MSCDLSTWRRRVHAPGRAGGVGRPRSRELLACLRPLLVASTLFALAAEASAQTGFGFGRGGGRENDPSVLWGVPDVRAGFHVCRLMYTRVAADPSGSGWAIEYPRADINFMHRIAQLTTTKLSYWSEAAQRQGRGRGASDGIGHTVVRATDPELLGCPWAIMASPGTAGFSDAEVRALREYLLKGGFLWADDFWGDGPWTHWMREIRRVLPEYPVVELTPTHGIFSVQYVVPEVPQIPSLNRWSASCMCVSGTGLPTQEHWGAEYATASMHGIFDEKGRLLVVMTHNTDIADSWEREADSDLYFQTFSAKGYGLGINLALWVMSR